MTVALFAPCYVDPLYPGVAVATLRLLEALGVRVAVPAGAVCCGQRTAGSWRLRPPPTRPDAATVVRSDSRPTDRPPATPPLHDLHRWPAGPSTVRPDGPSR